MSGEPFVPFGIDAAEEYLTLVDGVPAWLREPLLRWIGQELAEPNHPTLTRTQKCLNVQLNTRISLGVRGTNDTYEHSANVYLTLNAKTELELLRIADYLLSIGGRAYMGESAKKLDRILLEARSKWRVGERGVRLGLVARELAGLQASVEEVLSVEHQASRMLARAWSRIHDLEPDYSGAYSDAVRAVEIASIGIVVPNKRDATLGDVGGVIATNADWRTPLREHRRAPSNEVLAGMVRTLFSGHRDRHGRPDYSEVTAQEARAAVLLASTLVDWFISGAVRRSDIGAT